MNRSLTTVKRNSSFVRISAALVILLFLALPFLSGVAAGGQAWQGEIRVSSGSGAKGFPDTQVNSLGETVTVWMESSGEVIQIRGTVVTDDNRYLIFGRTVVVTNGNSYFPDIAIDQNNNVHLVWLEWADNSQALMYLSMDRFLTAHGAPQVLSVNPFVQHPPNIGNAPEMVCDSLGDLHVSWSEPRPQTPGPGALVQNPQDLVENLYNDVFYLRLGPGGAMDDQPMKISDSEGDSIFPDIAINPLDDNETVITWSDNSTGQYKVYFSKIKHLQDDVVVKTSQLSFGSARIALAPTIAFRNDGIFFISWSEKSNHQDDESQEFSPFSIKLAKLLPSGHLTALTTVLDPEEAKGDGEHGDDRLFPELELDRAGNIFLFWNTNRESSSNQLTDFILSNILGNVTTLSYYFQMQSFGPEFYRSPGPELDTEDSWRSVPNYITPILELGLDFEEWDGYYLTLHRDMTPREEMKKVSTEAQRSFFPSVDLDRKGLLRMSFQNGDDDQIYFNSMMKLDRSQDSAVFKSEEVFPVVAVACLGVLGYVLTSRGKDLVWSRKGYLSMLAPLYSTINKDDVLKNRKRQDICELLGVSKGMTFSELMRELGMKNGVLAYHLSLLEKNRYLKSARDGKYRRFFLYDDQMPSFTSIEKKIVETVKSNPRISHDKLASSIHVSKLKFNRKVEQLVHEGTLIPKYGDASVYYYARP